MKQAQRDEWTECDRCSADVIEAVVRHLEEGGPPQCRCGLDLPTPPAEWLLRNGYDGEGCEDVIS